MKFEDIDNNETYLLKYAYSIKVPVEYVKFHGGKKLSLFKLLDDAIDSIHDEDNASIYQYLESFMKKFCVSADEILLAAKFRGANIRLLEYNTFKVKNRNNPLSSNTVLESLYLAWVSKYSNMLERTIVNYNTFFSIAASNKSPIFKFTHKTLTPKIRVLKPESNGDFKGSFSGRIYRLSHRMFLWQIIGYFFFLVGKSSAVFVS